MQGIKENRLAKEKSPYLLQHKNNPVDWYSWGEEAFERAKKEDKPILLSIGYSTCHWCHVMEKESFEDEEVANILNKSFISIKVDREERPDIDSVYMNVCQIMTGAGGWPLNILLTPDKKPFYAGTYFPKHSRYGMIGFTELITNVSNMWNKDREKLLSKSNEIVDYMHSMNKHTEKNLLDNETINKAYNQFTNDFDSKYGGFSRAPKFPTPHNLLFLMKYYHFNKEKKALTMCLDTLKSMYKGGIYDHIGGGFSRYSTDEKWLVPHFEKMLYDNALLIIAYTDAYLITKDNLYKEIVHSIIQYIKRDMTSKEGGFYSAEDADSEGVEGKFYIWSYNEIISVLGNEQGELFNKHYGITRKGNFEGLNIPNLIENDLEDIVQNKELKDSLNSSIEKLFNYRKDRVHPHKDDKIITSWNGLIIAALAYAGRVLENKSYIDMAINSVEFIISNLIRKDGRLYIRYREKEAKNLGILDDYAYLIWGLIELYESTFEIKYLEKAIELNSDMINLFEDKENGGFFLYGNDSEQLIIRPKESYDGAMPSGNSIAAYNLLRLSRMTGNNELNNKLNNLIDAFSHNVFNSPRYFSFLMMVLLYNTGESKDIVIVGERNNELDNFINKINSMFSSYLTLILNNDEIVKLNKELESKIAINDKPTIYICENFSCKEPINDINKALHEIEY
ncbi:MAG: thioredoxin domain-containing protein [Vallitalea sp.]|nr:thioredoxin domain-containing protein [Vallitalea sp.]